MTLYYIFFLYIIGFIIFTAINLFMERCSEFRALGRGFTWPIISIIWIARQSWLALKEAVE